MVGEVILVSFHTEGETHVAIKDGISKPGVNRPWYAASKPTDSPCLSHSHRHLICPLIRAVFSRQILRFISQFIAQE